MRSVLFSIPMCALTLFIAACGDGPATAQQGGATSKPAPAAKVDPKKVVKADHPVVKFETSEGDILIELDRVKAPLSTENFLNYTRKKFYDGTVFHRIMSTFMIQGGGKDEKGVQKVTDTPIKNEGKNGLKNVKYSLSMARTSDLDSATSQFFLNVADNGALDYPNNGGYAVFGIVKDAPSIAVIEKIKMLPVGPNPDNPREISAPVKPPVVKKATIVSE